MSTFNVPTKNEVSQKNQEIFNQLEKGLGFVPNLYATMAYSENALSNFLNFSNSKTSFSVKEKEVINLAVSQVNQCEYCLAAHTAIGKMNGFSDSEVIELRQGKASFDSKLESLAKLSKNIAENRGATEAVIVNSFFNAGYTKENLVDAITLVGEITITNYLHKTTEVPVDFPQAEALV